MRYFPSIPVSIPERQIFHRLGGNNVRTEMTAEEQQRLRAEIDAAARLCAPCGKYEIITVKEKHCDRLLLENGLEILSTDFAKKCPTGALLWCAAVTVGPRLIEERDKLSSMASQAIYDATGSEMAEATMDRLQSLAHAELLRQGLALANWRFSPGYGDMPLSTQHACNQILSLEEMGIHLTDTSIMLPEKSITAWSVCTRIQ